jgi:hypothetical protein
VINEALPFANVDAAYRMRAPCRFCGSTSGRVDTRGVQDCVFCECGKFQYNAPRVETGRAVRTVTTVHNGISPKQRARVFMRDGKACAICHSYDKPLHVGHLLSVAVGMDCGLTDAELNDDENLAALCDECNLGLKERPVPLRLAAAILRASIRTIDGIRPEK